VALGLLVFLLTQYAGALVVPFINDDYVFLDKTRALGFLDLWRFRDLAFQWYRPWSRELHYWTLQHLFGARELPFHLASFALWLALLTSFWALARRIEGATAAAIATAAMAALAAWGVPLLWVAGVQELWMLLFSVLTLHAWLAGRRALATVTLAAALLSKETAAVLAPLALAADVLIEGRKPIEALRRGWPLVLVTAVWALVHPVLGGRLWHPLAAPLEPQAVPLGPLVLWPALRVALNADARLYPEHGWGPALVTGAIGALALAGMVAAAAFARAPVRVAAPSSKPRELRAPILFGATWMLIGWIPLLMPSLGWHAYYALLGCFGAWLLLGTLLARRPALAVVVVAALALLRPARAETPSLDWGSEWYQRRAAEFIRAMRAQLLAVHPRIDPHARLFFVRVPSNVGFLAGDAPALRVWYREPTLTGGFYSAYRPRAPGEPAGPDLFFRFDSTTGWVEVVPGPEDVARAAATNPRWEKDHVMLATTFAKAEDWGRAATEYAKLADARPASVDYSHDAAVAYESAGDSLAAAGWYAHAASLPDADPETRRAAQRLAHLRAPP
jgi:hypothetical protein